LISGAEAQRIGLVDELVAPERLVERAVEWCNGILALPPEAMSATRRTARADLAALLDENEAELSRLVDQWFSAETQTVLWMVVERLTKKKG
jgi:Delta3-Delta2-enoyl-CoA isomerase